MTAQLQYRRNDNDQNNVFPTLGGHSNGSSLRAAGLAQHPAQAGSLHNVNVNFSRTASETINHYAYVEDVAGNAGITGVSTDPFDWGVPQLSFSTFSSLRDLTPSRRTDTAADASATAGRGRCTRSTRCASAATCASIESDNQTDTNARGAFVFTGLYTSAGCRGARRRPRLRGLPARPAAAGDASSTVPATSRMRGKSLSVYLQDDWRKNDDADASTSACATS